MDNYDTYCAAADALYRQYEMYLDEPWDERCEKKCQEYSKKLAELRRQYPNGYCEYRDMERETNWTQSDYDDYYGGSED